MHNAKLGNHLKLNAPINGLPQDGGAGQPRGNLTFSSFQMSISPPLGHHYKSNSPPQGLQIVILVDTNLQCRIIIIIKKLTRKYQKVRLLLKTLLVIVIEFWPDFWIHLYVTPGIVYMPLSFN